MNTALDELMIELKESALNILNQSKDKRVIMQSILIDGMAIFKKGNASNEEVHKIAAKALALLVVIKLDQKI